MLRPVIPAHVAGMENQSAVSSVSERQPAKGRSAVSNGKRLHVIVPQGGKWSRRFRDVLGQIISDIGGHEGLSEAQRQLARRCATISICCERMEGEAAAGDTIDLEVYGKLADRLGRAFQRLGIRRQSRDVTPTLSDYLTSLPPDGDEAA